MGFETAPLRVLASPAAEEWIEKLMAIHGPLMFHQSGGCCDGSAPMCFTRDEFKVGGQDVLLGHLVGETPVWIGARQFEYWRHTQVIIDTVPGRGSGMSLEAPEGIRFVTRSRVFSDREAELLLAAREPLTGETYSAV